MKRKTVFSSASIALACLLAAGCADPSFETDSVSRTRGIVGGQRTKGQVWTGVVGLTVLNEYGRFLSTCTGTLIAPRVVLTAGHCVYTKSTQLSPGWNITLTPDRMQVKTGGNIGDDGMKGELVATVEKAVYHDTWKGDIVEGVENDAFDLGLLYLDTEVTSVPHYCVREDKNLAEGDAGVLVGYGVTNKGPLGQLSNGVARFGDTTVRDIFEHKIEVGDPSSVCNGDSGGPLFTQVGDRWVLTGSTSYGGANCFPKKGGAFMANAISARPWIDAQLEEWTGTGLGTCTGDGPGGKPPGDDEDSGAPDEQDTQEETGTDGTAGSGGFEPEPKDTEETLSDTGSNPDELTPEPGDTSSPDTSGTRGDEEKEATRFGSRSSGGCRVSPVAPVRGPSLLDVMIRMSV